MDSATESATLQSELAEFNKNPSGKIPPILEKYIESVAKIGCTRFPWADVRILLVYKMDSVMKTFDSEFSMDCLGKFPNVENVTFFVLHQRILERFLTFNAAPFTVQRLCELLTEPKDHYKRSDKYLRGLEKNVMVVSCVDPEGKKLSHEPAPLTDTSLINTLCPGAKALPSPSTPAPTQSASPFKPPSPVPAAYCPRPTPSDSKPSDKTSTVAGPCGTPATPWGSPVVTKATCMSSDELEPPMKQARIEPSEAHVDGSEDQSQFSEQTHVSDGQQPLATFFQPPMPISEMTDLVEKQSEVEPEVTQSAAESTSVAAASTATESAET